MAKSAKVNTAMPYDYDVVREVQQRYEKWFLRAKRSKMPLVMNVFSSMPLKFKDERLIEIKDDQGDVLFSKTCWFPKDWSANASRIVASKYFTPSENDLHEMISRVVGQIHKWGMEYGYFGDNQDESNVFADELFSLLEYQAASFNSPVWFNVGARENPQCSACFINSVEDNMESILDLAKTEALIFKEGSGSGVNLTNLRSSKDSVSGGGKASGPVSFMKMLDANAGVIKSGGRTRRSATMRILDIQHPDIEDFIASKRREEQKAHALIAQGYDGSLNGEAYGSVFFQNANHSVRMFDEDMKSASMSDRFKLLAHEAWECGDPGIQFADTINRWHTCKADGDIVASNPCCFVGETEVLTESGHRRISDLMKYQERFLPRIFSEDPVTGLPRLKRILRVWESGTTRELVEIKTEKGLTLRCTPEHRFFLDMENTIEAKDLTIGVRLPGLAAQIWKTGRKATYDRVASVQKIKVDPTPVYDLEVEDFHRFFVSTPGVEHGVLVHNSEYLFLNETACNLASINLMKFAILDSKGAVMGFDMYAFRHAVRVLITAMDIIVSGSSYPTEAIERGSKRYRTLGLGFTNLGAYLMARGLPYDSEMGREVAQNITAVMSEEAHWQSVRMARKLAPYDAWAQNRQYHLDVIKMRSEQEHESEFHEWGKLIKAAERHGMRNAQLTVIAPTGTISFMMDCESTGIEPLIALKATKELSGGGSMEIEAAECVRMGLVKRLENPDRVDLALREIMSGGPDQTVGLTEETRPVFETALGHNGHRIVQPEAHLKMMAAVQPFICGGISKTVNLPSHTTPDQIMSVYANAYKMGLKCIAVYRDGSKRSQPLNVGDDASVVEERKSPVVTSSRLKLPDTRTALTHHFRLGESDGYVTVGEYEEGDPGEMFIKVAKQGSALSGLLDAVGIAVSIGLQYGVPPEMFVKKFKGMAFEPSGWVDGKFHPSLMSYIFEWFNYRYVMPSDAAGKRRWASIVEDMGLSRVLTEPVSEFICPDCGASSVQTGTCFTCPKCGYDNGC